MARVSDNPLSPDVDWPKPNRSTSSTKTMKHLIIVFSLTFVIVAAVELACVQRYFADVLDEDEISELTRALSLKNTKQRVKTFVRSLSNATTQSKVKEMVTMFYRKVKFVEHLFKRFVNSVKANLTQPEIAELRAKFSEDIEDMHCDAARSFSDLYNLLANLTASDTAKQAAVLASANSVLDRFKQSEKMLSKLTNSMNYFLETK